MNHKLHFIRGSIMISFSLLLGLLWIFSIPMVLIGQVQLGEIGVYTVCCHDLIAPFLVTFLAYSTYSLIACSRKVW